MLNNNGAFEYYLIIINSVGLVAYLINMFLYSHTADKQIDSLLTIVSIIGGAAGILLAILLFDRKPKKENMMSRVFVVCIFVIQIIILLVIKGYHSKDFNLDFVSFFSNYKMLLAYLGIINLVTFTAFAVDKIKALEKRTRIRIVTLLGLSFVGGSIGGLLAMYIFRHKTKKDYFVVGLPLILIMQIIVLVYIMNVGW